MKTILPLLMFLTSFHGFTCDFKALEEVEIINGEGVVTYTPGKKNKKYSEEAKKMALKDCSLQGGEDCKIFRTMGEVIHTFDRRSKTTIRLYINTAYAQSILKGQEEKIIKNCKILRACNEDLYADDNASRNIAEEMSEYMRRYSCG